MNTEPSDDEIAIIYTEACKLIDGLLVASDQPAHSRSEEAIQRLNHAILLFTAVVTARPHHWPAYWALGKARGRLEQWDESVICFRHATQINPHHADVWRERSIAAAHSGLFQEAVESSRSAVALQPADVGLQANLALALLLSGKGEESRSILEQAIEQAPAPRSIYHLLHIVEEVLEGTRPYPTTMKDLIGGVGS